MKRYIITALLPLLFMLIACEDSKVQITLNPDGSGKLAYRSTLIGFGIDYLDLEAEEFAETLKSNLRSNILGRFEGVDAWKDVTYDVDEEGDLNFQATVYFQDINQLKLPQPILGLYDGFAIVADGDQAKLSLVLPQEVETTETLSGDELEEALARIYSSYDQQAEFIQKGLELYQTELHLNLPGEIIHSEVFTTESETSSVGLQGDDLINTIDVMMQDEAFLLEQAKANLNPINAFPVNYFEAQLFAATPSLDFKLTGPSFDYSSEVTEEVRAASEAFLSEFGLETPDLEAYLAKVKPLLTQHDMAFTFQAGSAPVASVEVVPNLSTDNDTFDVDFVTQLIDNSGIEKAYPFVLSFRWFENNFDSTTGWRCVSYSGGGIEGVLPDFTSWFNAALFELGIDEYYHC